MGVPVSVCRGVDLEKVKSRHLPLSVGCLKNFNGPENLTTPEQVRSGRMLKILIELQKCNK